MDAGERISQAVGMGVTIAMMVLIVCIGTW